MFAKIFTTNRSFDPSELARLPELEASAQLALLDQYAAYCKDHERSANEGTLAQALLAPHAASPAKVSGIELEVAKRALSLASDPDSIQGLLDHTSLGEIAAKRLCKLLPIDASHPANAHEQVFQARLQSATTADVATLSKQVATAEQAAWLVIRASTDTREA